MLIQKYKKKKSKKRKRGITKGGIAEYINAL
jgi:hypothetical protein